MGNVGFCPSTCSMLGQSKFADPVLWPNILSADYPDLLSKGAQKWDIEEELPRRISINSTMKTNVLRVLRSSPDASDPVGLAAPAISQLLQHLILSLSKKTLMHLLQEGVRLCWTHACTGDTVGKEVLVQFCRAHKLSPDACWLSFRDEQVSLDKTLQQVNGMI